MKLNIITPAGVRYIIHENGNIQRTDILNFKPSGQWKFIGIEGVQSRGMFIRFDGLKEWLETKPELLYKNGNPRYTVRDNDHGTFRSWGNTKYNGIKQMYFTK